MGESPRLQGIPVIPKIPKIPVSRNGRFCLCPILLAAIPVIPDLSNLGRSKNDMRLTHVDYSRLVKAAYNRKQANNEQPLLAKSTPASIRRECLNVYQERYHKKDEQTLRAFFGPANEGRSFLPSIKRFETTRFKPLDNYLKEVTENTDHKNLELLAWLIDFKHRPYSSDKNVILSEVEMAIIGEPWGTVSALQDDVPEKKTGESAPGLQEEQGEDTWENENEEHIPPDAVSNDEVKNKKSKRAVGIFLILICIGGLYGLASWNSSSGCVYWAGDHYEKVACDEDPNGRLIIPMSEKKRKSFRMISREDTITERSIGKLYYIKDSNRIEYYTEGGSYPEDLKRSLKKLSRYIFDKDSVNRRLLR